MRKIIPLLASCWVISPLATAEQVSTETYKKAEQQLSSTTSELVFGTVNYPTWIGDTLYYRSHTKDGRRFFKVDAQSQKKSLAFDHQQLASALAQASQTEVDMNKLPLSTLKFNQDELLKVSLKKKFYLCDLKLYRCDLKEPSVRKTEFLSPDGLKTVFIKEHNLWLRELANGQETQLTYDGQENFGYATNNAGWIRSKKPVVKWSPDSSKLTTFQHDSRKVGDMAVVSTNVGTPKIDVWKYPVPGDEHVFKIRRVIIDIDNKKVIPLNMPIDEHRSTITDHVAGRDGSLLDIDWSEDSNHFAFVSSSRDHKEATVKIANAKTGDVKTVFTETEETFFESGVGGISWRYLDKTDEILWFSQRSNWGHFYVVDASTGKIKKQLTKGDWTVIKLVHLDQNAGKIWFTGAGREDTDPYFHSLYRINLDGSDLTLLTPEKQHHRISLSQNGNYFLDRSSTYNEAETSFIRSTKTGKGFAIESMDISELTANGWKAPEPFVVKDRDGNYDLHGLLYKPSDFDPNKSYPVINYLYPGPQVGSIRGRHFRASRGDNQAIAELGFIVIELDALGTPGRSKAFHEFYYGKMGDSGIPDQVAAIKQLGKKRRWIDTSKVGIWGHSGGGFASTRALLTYPDFYQVAVSQAGNHDNRNYADEWGEKWHGMLEKNEDGTTNYDSQANQLIVENLKGKLLLAHGTTDTNVPPYNTLLVVEALIEANKDFDMLMLPNRGHGFAREPYMMRKRWDYFVQHLMGATPPKEFTFTKKK